MRSRLFFICLAGFIGMLSCQVKAQGAWDYNYTELSFSAGHEAPLEQGLGRPSLFPFVYKPTVSFSASYTMFNHAKGIEYGAGYMQFSPKEEEFYFLIGENDFGIASFSDLKILYFWAGFKYAIPLNREKIVPFIGIDFVSQFTAQESRIKDAYSDSSSSVTKLKGSLSPKVGVDYYINRSFGLFYQLKYNVVFEVGTNDPNSYSYNEEFGMFEFILSNNVGVKYRF